MDLSAPPSHDALRFGRFELQPLRRRLLADGDAVALGARALDVLLVLTERPGELVSKHELMERVWTDLVVEENNLSVQISTLRKALGADLIATVPGRGFRFTVPVQAITGEGAVVGRGGRRPSAISAALPALIGRDDELVALADLVARHRLVTIVGGGGIGKTRLAQSLLDSMRGSSARELAWVELAPLRSADQIAVAIGAALNVPGSSADPLAALGTALASQQVTLALDNAEHLVEGVAAAAQSLLDAAPGLKLLVTSQVPLKIGAERVFRLRGLDVPETSAGLQEARDYGAVALFVDRAQAADPRFALTEENLPWVIEICRRLDGTALAIELAAARVPVLGVRQLADALDERFRVLTAGQRVAPGRQQTLRAALSWSHDLLGASEQAVFRRLGLFVGSFPLELAIQVAADEALDRWAVLEALAALAERSLVDVDANDPPSYRLLDTPRAFALERLDASGEIEAARRRHAIALSQWLLRAYEAHLSGERSFDDAGNSHRDVLEDGRVALAWALQHDAEMAVALVPCLSSLMHHFPLDQRARMYERTEALLADSMPGPVRARWLIGRGNLRNYGGRLPYLLSGVALLRQLGLRRELYESLRQVVMIHSLAAQGGDAAAAQAAVDEMRALEDPSWPPGLRYWRWVAESDVAMGRAEYERCVELQMQCLALAEQAGNAREVGWTHVRIQNDLLLAGRFTEVVAHGERLLEYMRQARHTRALEMASLNLAAAQLFLEQSAPARRTAEQAWPLGVLYGTLPAWADYLALLAAQEGRPRAAAMLAGFSEAGYRRIGDPQQVNEERARQRAEAAALGCLGAGEFERLRARGADLSAAQAATLGFARADDPLP